MLRLALFSFRRRRLVLGAWLATLVAIIVAVGTVGVGYDDQFSLPDTESVSALQLLQRVSPAASGDQLTAVARATEGSITDGPARQRFERAIDELRAAPTVAQVASPYDPGPQAAGQVSADGQIAFATITLAGLVPNDITAEQITELLDLVEAGTGQGIELEVTGAAAQAQPEQGVAELVGLLAAAVVLFLVFGSLVAMSLPLITAVISIGVSVGAVALLSNAITVASFAPILASLLGLGVGVDYALFLVTRHRQEIRAGRTPEEAVRIAVDTAGRAVLFAGITVCIALLGLFTLGLSFLYGVAVSASLSVATTVFAAITLLPALLGFAGRKVLPRKQRKDTTPVTDPLSVESAAWQRWSHVLERRPKLFALVALAVMVVISIPFLSIRLGLTDQGSDPADSTTRQGYDLLAEAFGPGFNGPLLLVTDLARSADVAPTERLTAALQSDPGVASVGPTFFLGGPQPGVPAVGGVGLTTVYPTSAPQDEGTSDLVQRVRSEIIPTALAGSDQEVLVGGSTAIFEDFSDVIANKLPLFVGVVVLLSFILLTMVFRSLVVAGIAAGMNLLSAAATFGVVVAVFQWGYGLELLGVDRTGPILSFLPVILFAILFGLSMDYEVFLLSRIHEEWIKRGDNREAVTHGLAATGRTITAAAAIMVMLFLAFVLGPDITIKLFGLGLAAAVFLDALIIRSVLVPALMFSLGKANWYLPAWLDKLLPQLSVEGSSHEPPAPRQELAGSNR